MSSLSFSKPPVDPGMKAFIKSVNATNALHQKREMIETLHQGMVRGLPFIPLQLRNYQLKHIQGLHDEHLNVLSLIQHNENIQKEFLARRGH